MKRIIFIFFLTLSVFQLSSQNTVFNYTDAESVVTKNEENTKSVNVNRVLLDQIISENPNFDNTSISSFDLLHDVLPQ